MPERTGRGAAWRAPFARVSLVSAAGMEQVVVNGVILGTNYALMALGLTLIFAIMGVLNFAHGQMYVLGAL